MCSYGPLHMAEQSLGDQLAHTYNSSVRIWGVAPRTCRKPWTIGRGGKRESRISVLMARQDDDDEIQSSGRDWEICLYLKIPENCLPFIFKDSFWTVHITYMSVVKFQFLAQFPVDNLSCPVMYALAFLLCVF